MESRDSGNQGVQSDISFPSAVTEILSAQCFTTDPREDVGSRDIGLGDNSPFMGVGL